MDKTIEEIIKEESVNIAKSLEAIRNETRQNAQESLYYEMARTPKMRHQPKRLLVTYNSYESQKNI